MRQDQLEGLIAFIAAAEEHDFSAAGVRLGMTPSAIRQAVRSLEKRLGFALLSRTTRSMRLTEIGEAYLERVRPAVRALKAASEELGREAEHPSGVLRLGMPHAAYAIGLQPVLRRFFDSFPDVKLEVRIGEPPADLTAQGFDAGIRFGDPTGPDLVGVPIGPSVEAHVVASPEYLARRGVPVHPRNLLAHECIGLCKPGSGQPERWHLARGDERHQLEVEGRLRINDESALVQAALDGLGIACTISGVTHHLIETGRLVRLLTGWSPALPGLSLFYPARDQLPAKLMALIDFLTNGWSGLPLAASHRQTNAA